FNFSYTVARSIQAAKDILTVEKFDAIISDYFLGDGNAFEILELKIDIPIIVTTGTGSEEIAVQALKMGAYDYLIKDIDGFYLKMLPITVQNALHRFESEKELNKYHTNLEALIQQKTAELKKEIEINKEVSEDLLKMNMIFKNSNDVTFMTDPEGIITFINPKFTEVYGYTAEEIIGKTTPRILKADAPHTPDYETFWSRLKKNERISNFNYVNKRKDHTIVYIEESFEPILNTNNTLIGYLAIQRDITERIKNQNVQQVLYHISNAVNTTDNLEQLLKFIQLELEKIIETSNFYIALYDGETQKINIPYYEGDRNALTTTLNGKSITKYVIHRGKPLLAAGEKLLKLQSEGAFTITGKTPHQWLGVPIKNGHLITGVIVIQSYSDRIIYTDEHTNLLVFISDQIGLSIQNKKIEQDLKLALEKAMESDQLKTAFLHNISHEIRTPMNGILGFANLLKTPHLSDKKQQSFIDIITKSGERMLKTLNDLMDISRLETGQVKLHFTAMNINEELSTIYSFFKPEATAKNLVFNVSLPKNEPPIILHTDKEKVYAVLTNLIKNALKFSKIGSIEFGYTIQNDVVKFFVSDTGIGIPLSRQAAIFERFIQADINDSHVHEGAGLGLSISSSYIKMLGGHIWVTSIENEGSQFYFTLPLNSKPYHKNTAIKGTPATETANSKKIAVLIVEDEEIASEYLSIVLEDYCSVIYTAKNGQEAVDIFQKNPDIKLVLMDIKMPIMNGYEASQKIWELNNNIIIIAQTAFSFPVDKEDALLHKCTDYISKPIKATDLIRLIRKHIDI
ncbi:MAG: response regulator, partial [Lutibacter sp.]|nr:response regulator [Lutibacter sp.]